MHHGAVRVYALIRILIHPGGRTAFGKIAAPGTTRPPGRYARLASGCDSSKVQGDARRALVLLGNGRLPGLAPTTEIEGLAVQPLDARGEACTDLVQQALVIAVTERRRSGGSLLKGARGSRVAVVTQLSSDCPAERRKFCQLVPAVVVGVLMPAALNGHGPILGALPSSNACAISVARCSHSGDGLTLMTGRSRSEFWRWAHDGARRAIPTLTVG
jgi:hypothetical protein